MSKEDKHSTPHHPPKKQANVQSYQSGSLEYPSRPHEEDEIDLMEIVLFFWDRKATIAKVLSVFLILGVLVTVFSRVEYQASATLMPESESSGGSASNLIRQYGGMLGMGGGGQVGESGIPTSEYPNIIKSVPYQVELMSEPLRFSKLDTTMTPHEYFRDVYPPSTIDYIKRYTLGLPGQLLDLLRNNDTNEGSVSLVTKIDRDSVITLPAPQRSTIGKLRDRITIDTENGLITLSAELPDPRAAAELGNRAKNLLKKYVREYRTQKVNEELKYVREQVEEARESFEEAQMNLAEFSDSNVNLATARAQTREQELQSQYDLKFEIYNTLSQQLERTKLKVQETTPLFTVIEPIQVPTSNSKPNKQLIYIISIVLGVTAGFGFVIGKGIWNVLQTRVAEREN